MTMTAAVHAPLRRTRRRSSAPLQLRPGDPPLRTAIALAVIALVLALANRVAAEPVDPTGASPRPVGSAAGVPTPLARSSPIEAIVRARLGPALPPGLDIARVHLPAQLARLDTAPARVVIELPRELRAGRSSIKLTVRGKTVWVPVAIAQLTEVAIARRDLATGDVIGEADIAIEHRAVDAAVAPPASLRGASVVRAITAGDPIAARDVALPPPLPRGTQVTVLVQRGAVAVRGTGTLELAARPGAPATARLAASKLVVHGRLVAPATVVVGGPP